MTEGQISRWLKQPGDHVDKYEALVEVITDKVNAEVPSPVAGTMGEIKVAEGETVAVGTLICSIESADGAGAAPAAPSEPAVAPPAGGAEAAGPAETAPAPAASAAPVPAAAPPAPNGAAAGRMSPAVRRLAEEHQVDISRIQGTGIGGRVTKRDVEEFVARGGAAAAATPVAQPAPTASPAAPAEPAPAGPPPVTHEGDQLIPLSAMRRSIAEHMVRSKHTSPHAWCAVEIDMTNVVKLRSAERERFRQREGVDLTFVPFVIKAAVEALKDHPEMNATFTAEGILRRRAINISVAIGLDDGLIVPVIHDAHLLSLAGIAHKLTDLTTRARAGQLKLADVEGGTFCVNNPGTFGTVLSAPIINQPQAGIMTMEAIVKRPMVLPGDVIGIRSMMFSALSFDHRVLDGLQAGSFLGDVKKWLEAVTPDTPIY